MRYILAIAVTVLVLSLAATPQDSATKPIVSNDPLTAEQVAVYRAVLEDYTKEADGVLNVADRTEPLDDSGVGFDKACLNGLQLQVKKTVPLVHRLDTSLAVDRKFLLVDPDRQQERIKENEPQKLVKSAIDDHEAVTDKQVDDSVRRAFETGLFTLSEIAFDKRHRHAAVAYSFVCGELCGNGNLLLLTKVGQKWKVTKTCGGWVS
jgi:hypothetical protein